MAEATKYIVLRRVAAMDEGNEQGERALIQLGTESWVPNRGQRGGPCSSPSRERARPVVRRSNASPPGAAREGSRAGLYAAPKTNDSPLTPMDRRIAARGAPPENPAVTYTPLTTSDP